MPRVLGGRTTFVWPEYGNKMPPAQGARKPLVGVRDLVLILIRCLSPNKGCEIRD